MIVEQCVLAFIGVAAGFLVAAGLYAFAVTVGVVTRIVARTKTVKHLGIIEDCIVVGGTLGSVVSIYQPQLPFGVCFLVLYGIFSGIQVGCLSIAVAETINVIPVLAHRIRLRTGLVCVVVMFSLGKAFGALWQMVLNVH